METVNPDVPSTLEAAALCKMADRGQITGALVDGPLALDNAISPEAAKIKKIDSPVAGRANVLVVPDLEAGNMLAKSLTFLAGADAAGIVQKIFLREGITLILNARPTRVVRTETGKAVHYEDDGQGGVALVDEILVGAGRAPNVEGLNLEAAGVNYEGGKGRGVLVNDRLQTSNPNIYAAGDICLPYQFTHLADASARLVIQNALFFGGRKFSKLTIPWCTYTDLEVAHVGLSEQEAEKRQIAYQVFKKPLKEVDRAILDGEAEGFVKILVKKGSDEIIGATLVASHAGEMISEVTCAMVGKVGLGTLAGVIHPYPTQAEAIRATGDLYNRTRLTPLVKKLFTRFLAWRR